jgi:hypothetical protein
VLSPFEAEIEAIVQEYTTARKQSQFSDASDVISDIRVKQMQTRCLSAIERAAGRSSIYYEQAKAVIDTNNNAWGHLANQVGVADSLLHNIRAGYMKTLEELVHGEIFSDFLEMAQYLLDCGYKDAAAVIGGSTLESHLKQLCKKVGIPVDVGGKPKKADLINSELATAQAYSKLDQKNVTAWLGLRNNAAHGDYHLYDKAQVSLLINAVRDFISRIPA